MKRQLFLALCLSAMVGTISAHTSNDEVTTKSSSQVAKGRFTKRTFKIEDFTMIDVSNVVKVVYTQGENYKVQLTGRTDWLDYMVVSCSGGKLTVKAKNSKKFKNVKKKDQPDGQHNFILELSAPCLQNVSLSGVSSFATKYLSSDGLYLRLSGVSKLSADVVECASMSMNLGGASELTMKDVKSEKLNAEIAGSSKLNIQRADVPQSSVFISGASKVNMPSLMRGKTSNFSVNGASTLTLNAEISERLAIGLAGASKGKLTYKGGKLQTGCTGASKLQAQVDCKSIRANCDGASKTDFDGTADNVEIDRGGVAANINTSRLNQF